MSSRRGVRRWFRLPVYDRELSERDVEAELRAHLEHRIERLVAGGMSPAAARAEAERRLGGLEEARERLAREAWRRDRRLSWLEWVKSAGDDVRYAARSVLRERGYATVVVLTLALGIGANATMFGVLDRLLLTPPAHVVAADALQRVYGRYVAPGEAGARTFAMHNYPTLTALRERVDAFAAVGGYMSQRATLGSGPDAREVELRAVTAGFLDMLGARPQLGRFIAEADDIAPQGTHVVVLGDALWRAAFGARPDVVGETIELSGARYTVIGVAPPGLTGTELVRVDAWVPLSVAASGMPGSWPTNWNAAYMRIVGRLRADATPEVAMQQATAALRAACRSNNRALCEGEMVLANIRAGDDATEPLEARIARWLIVVSGIVLVVACANVANLYFARGLRRHREVALRLALGISQRRLLRLLLAESLVLAVLGGALALLLAGWGAALVQGMLLPGIDWGDGPLDARVLGVAGLLTLVVAVATGLAPALQARRTDLKSSLGGAGQSAPPPGRARNALAVLQAAFCVVLLVGAGLFVRSFWNVQRMDLGMDAGRVVALQLEWPPAPSETVDEMLAKMERLARVHREAAEHLARLPGIEQASASIGTPFHGAMGVSLRVDGRDSIPSLPGGGPFVSAVTSGYFETLGTPLLRGRLFGGGDGAGSEPVAIVSRTMAETLWPGREALGQCLYIGRQDAPCSRVVGVVADVRRFRLLEEPAMQYYVPLGQERGIGGLVLLVRAAGRLEAVAEDARRALFAYDPTLRYVQARSFDEILDPQRRPWRLGASLFALCGLLAFAIAFIGLYSVISYLVTHRTHEIGIRVALGGLPKHIVRMVMRQSLLLAGGGVVIGIAIAAFAAPALEGLLFETSARDGLVFAAVVLTLIAAALVASAAPAWRATRIAPAQALRES